MTIPHYRGVSIEAFRTSEEGCCCMYASSFPQRSYIVGREEGASKRSAGVMHSIYIYAAGHLYDLEA